MLRLSLIILVLMVTSEAVAVGDKFIVPPKRIVKIAKQLAYPDFPNFLDILAVARVESAYRADAYNPEKGVASVGIMQVRKGSKDPDKNMFEGIGLLRQYYKSLGSSSSAVMSYNIGIKNYKDGKLKISAKDYHDKFLKRRAELVKYFAEQKH